MKWQSYEFFLFLSLHSLLSFSLFCSLSFSYPIFLYTCLFSVGLPALHFLSVCPSSLSCMRYPNTFLYLPIGLFLHFLCFSLSSFISFLFFFVWLFLSLLSVYSFPSQLVNLKEQSDELFFSVSLSLLYFLCPLSSSLSLSLLSCFYLSVSFFLLQTLLSTFNFSSLSYILFVPLYIYLFLSFSFNLKPNYKQILYC